MANNPETAALTWGSAMIAFAPVACFFFQVTYPKSQLIIVFITAAFFFLLASLGAGVTWYVLDPTIGLGGIWAAILPGVLFQFLARCGFVALYHKVERVIEASIDRGEQDQAEGETDDDVGAAKLHLELNDVACGIAAGTGFGGMHAVLLYGSLIASESSDLGVLYQASCPMLPSIVVSALHCFFFFFLDMIWMLFTFFGMRRRMLFPRGGGSLHDMNPWNRGFGSYYGNTRTGGNAALLTVLGSHLLASGLTTFNGYEYGCTFSIPSVAVVMLVTSYMFWSGVSKIYSPLPHSTARLSLPASFSYAAANDDPTPPPQEGDANDETAPIAQQQQDTTQAAGTSGVRA